ncbi:MAG TPA: beta-L-arabinofuranosidase domain-containing protein [Acidobacteriaceae bacterium]|nr:beta-L-arabinofuranosidase domain-containing protein [Acidobacteriaceae bacterium]
MKGKLSRRKFLASAAISVVPTAVAYAHPRRSGPLAFLAGAPETSKALGNWKDAGVIDLSNSPYAKLKTVPVRAVVIRDGFWSKRRKTNLVSSIPSMHDELLEHGRMDNFLRLEGKSSEPQKGPVYSDSDIYKWTEAVGFQLQVADQPELRKTTDGMIRDVVAVQEPSGYLNTYYNGDRKPLRMQYDTQTTGHELYCIGHMLQGAIAYYRATGDTTLLDAGIRFVDNFLIPNYGPAATQKAIVAGHPEIEMALIELARTTGERKYVDLAGYILHGDDRVPLRPQQIVYMYCGIPFTSRTKLEGHAVRAMYACCGATDYYLETGDQAYWKTLNVLWNDLTAHQLYVNGGVGARAAGEAFGDPYELPNAQAYGESCAAIGNMMWNWRMLSASGEAKFADVIERALYNGINSGMSLDGKTYCYRNPLAFDPAGESRDRHLVDGKIRNAWYDTTCCPPNLERTFASLSGYFYSTNADGVYVHLYDNSEMNWHLHDGTALKVEQTTNYPWNGDVKLTVSPSTPKEFVMYVRIPGWSAKNSVKVNGKEIAGAKPGEYLPIRRRWAENDTIDLRFDMTTHLLKANPAVTEDRGRVAFQRGPLVFCMEHLDQADHSAGMNLAGYTVLPDPATTEYFEPALLDGVMVLTHPATISKSATDMALYFPASTPKPPESATTVRLIPYYAWANRESASMQVWIPYKEA